MLRRTLERQFAVVRTIVNSHDRSFSSTSGATGKIADDRTPTVIAKSSGDHAPTVAASKFTLYVPKSCVAPELSNLTIAVQAVTYIAV